MWMEHANELVADLGATTDEEVRVPATVNHPETQLSLNSDTSLPRTTSRSVRRRVSEVRPFRVRKPTMKLWRPNPRKVHTFVDKKGKQVVIDPRKGLCGVGSSNAGQASEITSPSSMVRSLVNIPLSGEDVDAEKAAFLSALLDSPNTSDEDADEVLVWENFIQGSGTRDCG